MNARTYVNQILKKGNKNLRVAFLGGSLTKGELVKKEKCFVSLFEKKLPEVLGEEWETTILRYGESGTMSANGLFKVRDLVSEKPDLVFLDYAMNDTGDRYLWEATEGICYQLLEAGIGVVVLLFCNDQGLCTRGAMERVAAHYHFPVYDIGAKIIMRMKEGSLTWQEYGQDYVHPTVYGHELIADYLLQLFQTGAGEENSFEMRELPDDSAFEGAFRKSVVLDLSEKMKKAEPGDIIFDEEISFKMLLMEFWQDSVPNDASVLISLNGKKIASADAYASMAWRNPVCRYIGGDGMLEKYQLTVSLGKSAPPAGWDYSMFRFRFMVGK